MKFVCQNCKAKYQIDDEKVAGRQLKMKCRKCGHVIPISGMGLGGGATAPAPRPPSARTSLSAPQPAGGRASLPAPRPAPPRSSVAAPRPSGAPRLSATPRPSVASPRPSGAPRLSATPRPSVTAASATTPHSATAPRATPSPRRTTPTGRGQAAAAALLEEPVAPAASAPPSATPASGPTSTSSVSSPALSTSRLSVPSPALEDRWASLPPQSELESGPRPSGSPGALAGAFQSVVGGRPEGGGAQPRPGAVPASGRASLAPTFSEPPALIEQWFVGIDGTPTGPLTPEQIRNHAAAGSVSLESLVWREGFEDWLPVSKFPELAALVQEAQGMSPSEGQTAAARPSEPSAAPSPSAPGASPPSSVGAAETSPLPEEPSTTAAVVRPTSPSPEASSEEEPLVPIGRSRSGFSPVALVAIAVAVAFGLAMGFVVFGGEKTKVIREVVEVPVPTEPAPAENVPPPEAEPEVEPEPVASNDVPQRVAGKAATNQQGTNTKAKPADTTQVGLSGLSGLKGLNSGPQAGPATEGAGTASQPLSTSQIQSTVSRFTPSVRRSCWQPALDARDPSAPTTARVTVSITVGADGKVQGASADGDPRGYPGLGSCISRRVRGWTFPPSSGTTTVQVPFVFAAQ